MRLAFIVGLQRLSPRQTAVLVLRDVLGFSTAEVAEMLDTTGTAVKGALQRARAALETDGLPRARAMREIDGRAVARATPEIETRASAAERDLVRRFADAFVARDIDALVGLLTDDAWLAMPPAPHEYHGPAAIVSFLQVSFGWWGPRRILLTATRANGQPAFACHLIEPGDPVARPAGLMVLTLHGDRISGMPRFLDSGVLTR